MSSRVALPCCKIRYVASHGLHLISPSGLSCAMRPLLRPWSLTGSGSRASGLRSLGSPQIWCPNDVFDTDTPRPEVTQAKLLFKKGKRCFLEMGCQGSPGATCDCSLPGRVRLAIKKDDSPNLCDKLIISRTNTWYLGSGSSRGGSQRRASWPNANGGTGGSAGSFA